MKLPREARDAVRSTLAAKGATSRTDDDATAEEYLAMALDDLDELERAAERVVNCRSADKPLAEADLNAVLYGVART